MSVAAQLDGQTVLVIGGSSGIGLETARRARAEGAEVILTARGAERLHRVGLELGASIAAFDVTESKRLARFFGAVQDIDHVLVSGPGTCFAGLTKTGEPAMPLDPSAHQSLATQVGRAAAGSLRPGGTVLFLDATATPRDQRDRSESESLSAATRALALELAPIRVNSIAAGFVDTPLAANALGDDLAARRAQLCATLPIRRVVAATDVAALAVHLMTNGAVTGATFDIDGGQRLVEP